MLGLALLGGGYSLLTLCHASGETIAYTAAFAMLIVPRFILKGAFSTWNIGRREVAKMRARDRYYETRRPRWQNG